MNSSTSIFRFLTGLGLTLLLLPALLHAQVEERVLIDVEMHEGTNMSAALSPDSSTLVIALQGVLWTLPAEGGTATALTPAAMDAQEPVWSPDGSTIAFYAFAENSFSVWGMAPDGSNLRQLSVEQADARYPSFNPDGSTLFYSSDSGGGYSIRSLDLQSGEYIQLTNAADTGYIQPTVPYFSGEGNAIYPILSPDASTLAFVIDGPMDTLVMRPLRGSTSYIKLFSGSLLGAPQWSEDGQSLYIVSVEESSTSLNEVELDGSSQALVSTGDIFPFRPVLTDEGLLYTADGLIKQVALDGTAGDSIPFSATVTLDRTPYQRRSYDFAETGEHKALGIIDPVLSPDGSTVVFAALGDLWSAATDGGEPARLTDDVYVDLSPSFSPDGSTLVFVSDRGGKADLWTMVLDSGKLTRITDSPVAVNGPVWSPDGSQVAFLQDALTSVFLGATVQVLDLASGKQTEVSDPVFGPSAPAWSADGSSLAIYYRSPINSRFREGHNVILIMPASGSKETRMVSPVPGESLGRRQFNRPAWSMEGQLVYRLDGALWSVLMDSDGNMQGDSSLVAETGENPSWSADASYLVYLDGNVIKLLDTTTDETDLLDVQPVWQRHLPDTSMTLRAGRLFDGTGDSYLENVDVHIVNGVISAVVPAGSQPVSGELVDASERVVIPGLIEGHAHQSTSQGIALGELFLSYGITTVRETGTDPYYAVERREAEASGRRVGPRVFTAGPLNEGARVSYGVSETVGTVEAAENSMRLSTALQLDMYKSYVRQDYTVQRTVIELAHASGIPVSSHELYPAVANGIDQLEHFGATSRRGYSLKSSRLDYSYQDVISLVAESGLVITPTLAMGGQRGQDMSVPMATLIKLVNAGARIQAGTDSPFIPHGEALHSELKVYVDAGLSTAWALRSATSESAQAMGAGDQIGTLAPGYLADMLILDDDPLADITALGSVQHVFKSGFLVWSADQ